MASGPRATGPTAGDEGAAPEFDAIIALPFGPFGIRARDGQVRELVFLPPGTPLHDPRNATAGAAAHALRAWIAAPDEPFPVPLAPCGTPFRRRVWAAIAASRADARRPTASSRPASAAHRVRSARPAAPTPFP